MTEYIAKCKEFIGISGATMQFPEYIDMNQEIVRCRNCVYYDITGEEYRLYSDKVYCEKLWKYVEPDGFCAWAERRVEE